MELISTTETVNIKYSKKLEIELENEWTDITLTDQNFVKISYGELSDNSNYNFTDFGRIAIIIKYDSDRKIFLVEDDESQSALTDETKKALEDGRKEIKNGKYKSLSEINRKFD